MSFIINPYLSNLDPIYQAYFNALPNSITPTVKAAQNAFCISLRSSGLLSRMKCGYFFHAGGVGNAKINLANPSTYLLTAPAGDPIFTEGAGCKSSGTTYFSSPFKTNEYAGIQSNISYCMYISDSNTVSSGAFIIHGAQTDALSRDIEIRPLIAGNVRWNIFSNANSNATNGSGNHKHLYVQTVDSSNQYMYLDGIKTTIASAPVAPVFSINHFILAANIGGAAGFYTSNMSCYFIFDKFNDTDESNFRSAWNTYKAAVSLP